MPNRYLSSTETAEYLGLSAQTILALAQSGKLPGYFISRRWKFKAEELDAYVSAQTRGR